MTVKQGLVCVFTYFCPHLHILSKNSLPSDFPFKYLAESPKIDLPSPASFLPLRAALSASQFVILPDIR